MRRKVILMAFAVLCGAITISGILQVDEVTPAMAPITAKATTIIIDPGHGGPDGGAVGVLGVVEKDINLAISLRVADFFEVMGYDIVMTRESDISIHDSDVVGVGRQKISDLNNRLEIMKQYPEGIVLSVHQNQFSQSKYSGAQVFYGAQHSNSSQLAMILQTNFVSLIQPENNRQIKQAPGDIYLMQNAPSAAVLIECGFLSNPQEAEMLTRPEYQNKLAFVIFASTVQYIHET